MMKYQEINSIYYNPLSHTCVACFPTRGTRSVPLVTFRTSQDFHIKLIIQPTSLVKETWNWEHFGSRNSGHELPVGSHYLYSMAWVILIPKQVKKVEKHCSWLQYTRFTWCNRSSQVAKCREYVMWPFSMRKMIQGSGPSAIESPRHPLEMLGIGCWRICVMRKCKIEKCV
jgi:hypothetical protein